MGRRFALALSLLGCSALSLPAVAQNAKSNVKYRVEEMTGLTVHAVNVHVESIRV